MAQSRQSKKAQQEERRRRLEVIRAQEAKKRRRSNLTVIGGSITAAIVILAAVGLTVYNRDHKGASYSSASTSPDEPNTKEGAAVKVAALAVDKTATSPISGAVVYAAPKDGTSAGPITYGNNPPVGGTHSATLLNCGAYTAAVPNEFAVTDLEHGAVWITYQPILPATQIATLQKLVKSYGGAYNYVTLSPFTNQTYPIELTAWGVQLKVDSAADPRIKTFITQYRKGSQAPDPTGSCGPTGGTGSPVGTILVTPSASASS